MPSNPGALEDSGRFADVIHPAQKSPSLFSRADWRMIAYIGLFLLLIYQVALPFLMILWTSLKTVRPGEPDFLTLAFSLANFARALDSAAFWYAAWNTIVFVGASTILVFVLGAFVAWAVERTNMPLAQFFGMMMIARVIIPGVLITISGILLASSNIDLLNHIVRDIFGVRRRTMRMRDRRSGAIRMRRTLGTRSHSCFQDVPHTSRAPASMCREEEERPCIDEQWAGDPLQDGNVSPHQNGVVT